MKQLISVLDLGNKLSPVRLKLLNFLNTEKNLSSEWFEFLRYLLFNDVESTYEDFLVFVKHISVFPLCIFKHNSRPVYQVYRFYGFKKSPVIDDFLSLAD